MFIYNKELKKLIFIIVLSKLAALIKKQFLHRGIAKRLS